MNWVCVADLTSLHMPALIWSILLSKKAAAWLTAIESLLKPSCEALITRCGGSLLSLCKKQRSTRRTTKSAMKRRQQNSYTKAMSEGFKPR